MADISAFPGIRYRPSQISDLAAVVAPPYDVISPDQQNALYQRHPHNIVRLILGLQHATDTPEDNRYTRSRDCFHDWLAQGVLAPDPRPAIYLTAQDFETSEGPLTRFGLMARVRLEPFDKGIIRPHEATFASVKIDRLRLMQACHANFSPIFALCADSQGAMAALEAAAATHLPLADFCDPAGERHRLWAFEDPRRQRELAAAMVPETVYIADGHHRYETALAYRDWLADTQGPLPTDHPANFVLMYLCRLESPGLRILPAHRLVWGIPREIQENFLASAGSRFGIDDLGGLDPGEVATTLHRLEHGFQSEPEICAFGLVLRGCRRLYRLRLDPSGGGFPALATSANPVDKLDVSVLNRLLLTDLMQLPPDALERPDRIRFTNEALTAVQSVTRGECDAAFLLKPVRVDQVRQIAECGLTMPRKSTYFAPKVISGLVINSLRPAVATAQNVME
jgi:uncharacterized protein (DUF1015 family)